jgi:hypothetical protein
MRSSTVPARVFTAESFPSANATRIESPPYVTRCTSIAGLMLAASPVRESVNRIESILFIGIDLLH